MSLNQLAGSARVGSIFRMVERDDRVFHVYGAGRDKLVVEVEAESQSKTGSTSTKSSADGP